MIIRFVLTALLLRRSYGQSEDFQTYRGPCPFENEDVYGDFTCGNKSIVLLGGLFPLHAWLKDASHELGGRCGDLLQHSGFQRMEAMRFAVEEINSAGILPGVQLAFEMRDTCISAEFSRRQTVRFINRAIDNDGLQCGNATVTSRQAVSGVIGAASSGSSLAAADLLSLFGIPQISYASTSALLSNKERYRYFLRTLPPDNFQAQAMMSLLEALNATYFSLVHSSGSYGSQGGAEVRREVEERSQSSGTPGRSVCIATDRSVGPNSEGVSAEVYKTAMSDLVDDVGKNATVAIGFLGVHSAVGFFRTAAQLQFERNLSENHIWIASDGWATAEDIRRDQSLVKTARGTLGVAPKSITVEKFDRHFLSLHPDNNTQGSSYNPWLSEFWKSVFKCDPDSSAERERELCRGYNLEDTPDDYHYTQNLKVAFVIDAVYAFAYALRQFQQDACGKDSSGICSAMLSQRRDQGQAVDGKALLNYLLKVQFSSSSGHSVSFTESGDLATAIYDITNLQVDPITGKGVFVKVGTWERLPRNKHLVHSQTFENGVLQVVNCQAERSIGFHLPNCTHTRLALNVTAIQWHSGTYNSALPPVSQCSVPCAPGYSASSLGKHFPQSVRPCCWKCTKCPMNWYTPTQHQTCKQCPLKQKPNGNQTSCIDMPVKYWNTDLAEAVAAVILSAVGLAVTVLTAILAISVKHLLPEHSALCIEPMLHCLLGVGGLVTAVFTTLGKPTNTMCIASSFWINLSLTLLIGPLLLQFLFLIYLNQKEKQRTAKKLRHYASDTSIISASTENLQPQPTLSMLVLLVVVVAVSAVAAATKPPEVYEDIEPNSKWTISCRYGNPVLVSGLIFNAALIILVMVARYHCLKLSLPVHSVLSKAAIFMPVVLLIAIAGVVATALASTIGKSAVLCFSILAIAFAVFLIVLIPDIFATLTQERASHHTSEYNFSHEHRSSQNEESTVLSAFRTLQQKSLFNSEVRKTSRNNRLNITGRSASSRSICLVNCHLTSSQAATPESSKIPNASSSEVVETKQQQEPSQRGSGSSRSSISWSEDVLGADHNHGNNQCDDDKEPLTPKSQDSANAEELSQVDMQDYV